MRRQHPRHQLIFAGRSRPLLPKMTTDFMIQLGANTLVSNNTGVQDFVVHADSTMEASAPLSPSDRKLYQAMASKRADLLGITTATDGFVLHTAGGVESSEVTYHCPLALTRYPFSPLLLCHSHSHLLTESFTSSGIRTALLSSCASTIRRHHRKCHCKGSLCARRGDSSNPADQMAWLNFICGGTTHIRHAM